MLLQVNIKNFALIENLSINFQEGFTVFTGETGAGKSILIDAINYVIGSKFNKDLIRTGEKSTYVEAVFSVENNTKEVLESLDIELDDTVILSRETFSSGRTVVKINGKSVILTALKAVSSTVIDIHGQHDNVNLLDSSTHVQYLDDFCGSELSVLMDKYSQQYTQLNEIANKLKKLENSEDDSEKILNFIQFQIEEITNAKLKPGEDKELEERAGILTNSEKISLGLNNSYSILNGSDSEGMSVFDGLDQAVKELKFVESKVDAAKDIADNLREAYYTVEQCVSDLRSIKDNFVFDMNELSEINNRIYEISKLKKKYGSSIEEIAEYKNSLEKRLEEIVNKSKIIDKLKAEADVVEKKCRSIGSDIHDIRLKAGKILEHKIIDELGYIGMSKSKFSVEIVEEESLKPNGLDAVRFLISTNPGEPLKNLERIASGGELSRIMLALKTIFIHKDKIPTIIFDEIDTGISGVIAQRVAEKMFLISKEHQVLCISHLPQIATMSDNHYYVYKEVVKDKTYTSVKELDFKMKTEEISRMISGVEPTEITLSNAKQLLEMAENLKKKI